MALEGVERLSGSGIPQPDGVVHTPRGENATIRTKSNALDPVRVALEGVEGLSGSGIPQPNNPVPTP